ncbi:MAG: PQQ-binding-like beta-propeller repeat protein, partial [Fuerstiella sp.]
MQRFSAIAIICLTFMLPAAHSVSSAADVPTAADLQPLGLELRWNSQAVLDVGRDVVAFVTNDENNLYVQSSGGILTVFNAENGRKLWSAQIGRLNEPASSAISNKNLFVVVVGPVIYGFNKFTGVPVFEQRLPKPPSASPVINESTLFVPVLGGAIYAYSLGVLEYSYRYGKLPDTEARPFLWRYIGKEEIIRPPALGEKALAFATEAGNLISIATRGTTPGRTEFQMQLSYPASAALAIADNKSSSSILMLTEDNLAFSVDLLKGSTEWVYPMGRPMRETPIVIGDDVYVVTTEGSLTRLNRNNFSPNWGRPVEIPLFKAPTLIGVGVEDVEIDAQVKDDLELISSSGILVKEVEAKSPGSRCGLMPGDIIVSLDDITVATVNELKASLLELARRVERPVRVIRDGKIVTLKLVIPVQQWDVQGIDGVAAIGRFSVFGIDGARRLVAFDKSTAAITGRTSVADYGFLHHNYLTDQVFLVSSSGEIVCLREIGPTFRMPEVSSASKHAK